MAKQFGKAGTSRRSFVAGGAAAAFTLAGLRHGSAAESGEITVYSGRNENLVGPVLADFTESSGIEVKARYGDTAEMAAAIMEEGDNSPADLYLAQDASALGAVEAAGLFAKLPADLLERIEPKFHSAANKWTGVTGRARVAVYNTDMLEDSDLPPSVKDLTASEWSGKIGWAPTNGSFQSFVTAFRVLEGDDAAGQWLEDMKSNSAVTFESNGPITRAVAAGEISAGLVNHYYVYEVAAEEGTTLPAANHYFAGGDVGSLINVSGIGLLATAGNPDGAIELVDYLLQPEAQSYFATNVWEYPLIEGMDIAEGLIPLDEIDSPDIDLGSLDDLQGTLELLAETGVL